MTRNQRVMVDSGDGSLFMGLYIGAVDTRDEFVVVKLDNGFYNAANGTHPAKSTYVTMMVAHRDHVTPITSY